MAKLPYPFIRGLQGTIAILDENSLYTTGNVGDENNGTLQLEKEYVFNNAIICVVSAGTVYTPCNFTRINGDAFTCANGQFKLGDIVIDTYDNTTPTSAYILVKRTDNEYWIRVVSTISGSRMIFANGINPDADYFEDNIVGFGRTPKFNFNFGDHAGYVLANNSTGGVDEYHIFDYGTAYTDLYQMHLTSAELYDYSPTGYPSNNEPLGGDTGSNDPSGDNIEMPPAPDETVSGTLLNGFLNIYSPSDSQLKTFGGALWTNAFNVKWYDVDSLANLVLNTISDPINFIIGLFMLPIVPDKGTSTGIYLGGINVNTVSAPRVSKQFKTVSFGKLNIDELYGNYLDYAGSRLSIYLPYIGTADLDIQEVNGGSVELEYIIDCFTGACVANVRCTKTTVTPWGMEYNNKTVHSYSGNVAVQLPISAGSFDTMTQGLINIGLGLGTNAPAIAMQGAGGVLSGLGGDATTRGSLSSNTGRCCYQTPYLMFTRPIESRPASLAHVHGISAGAGGTLSTFKGYVECSDVNLSGVCATDIELDMIKSLLQEGVYV